ncbi:MAG: response regulator [Oligoflexales bacterium]
MDQTFADKSARVLIVDGSGALRTLVSEVLKTKGFTNITGVPTIKDALGILEAERVDWILCPLMAGNPENGMHLLKIAVSVPELKHLRVSFLLEETEQNILPLAFEWGLLSFHKKPYTKDSLNDDLSKLLSSYEKANWESTLVSGTYLRTYFIQSGKHEEAVKLDKKLISLYPSQTSLLQNLIPSLAKLGKKDEAQAIAKQLVAIGGAKKEEMEALLKENLGAEVTLEADKSSSDINILGVDTVLVVDSDDAVVKDVRTVLENLGVKDIVSFSDGETAVKYVEDGGKANLVIQEWRIPKLPGPIFLQRAKRALSVPMILVTSLVGKDDTAFLKEIGIATVVNKPLDRETLLRSIVTTIQQEKVPTDVDFMENKMRSLLYRKKINEAEEIRQKLFENSKYPSDKKKLAEAEFAFAKGKFEEAKKKAIEVLKENGDSIVTLNLLGKTLMTLREFDISLKCFEKAQKLAPHNIERLCEMAEVHSELKNEAKAEESIDTAKRMSPGDDRVTEAQAKLAINSGKTEKAQKVLKQLENLDNVVSYMNNQAIALSRCDRVEEGVATYKRTIESIPDDRKETKAIVVYNLALAFVRAENYNEAKIWLSKCSALESRVKAKATSLLARIKKALDSGEAIDLFVSQDESKKKVEESETITEQDEMVALVKAQKGDIGLYLIFTSGSVEASFADLLSSMPRFKFRQAIERDASGGADRLMANKAG